MEVKYDSTERFVDASPSFSSGDLDGTRSNNHLEIFNPQPIGQKILHVTFKASTDLGQAFPPDSVALASAALLKGEWDEKFHASVLEDLNAIGDFAQPFWSGQTPCDDIAALAGLAKQDFDLKLQWSAVEYARRSIFSMVRRPTG